MGEYDAGYENLKSQRRQNESLQKSTQSDIDNIDQKIKTLKDAYAEIDEAKETVKHEKRIVNSLPNFYGDSWKGKHADDIYEASEDGGLLSEAYKTYINALDAIEDSINDEICRLNDKKSEKWGILQGLVRSWNHLSTQIRNYFN